MQSNTYTGLAGLFLLVILSITNLSYVSAQEENDLIDLRFQTSLDCSQQTMTAIIQMKAQSDTLSLIHI